MIIETKQLTKLYGGRAVLDDINLAVRKGSVYGLVGPNGAGKTTLLSIVAGLRQKTAGELNVAVPKQQIAVCPDSPGFEPWLSAFEVMQLAAGLVGVARTTAELKGLLVEAGLGDVIDRKVGGFSRGMTQRLALATTIVGNPELIILDEPSSALDPKGRVEVLDMVAKMGNRSTVIFSSHILDDVQRVCDTIGILKAGKLIYQGELKTFLEQNVNPVWEIRTRNSPKGFKSILEQQNWVADVKELTPTTFQVEANSTTEAERQLVKAVGATDAQVISIQPVDSDLEHAFLKLTQSEGRS